MTDAGYGEHWPKVRSTVRAITVGLTSAGTPKTITSQSCRLCGWSLSAGAAGAPSTITAAFAAAASGAATLPVGQSLSGFAVTLGTFTVANTATVTITGAVGGTITYTMLLSPGTTTQINLIQDFIPPLQPANPAVAIAVTFNGNANSPGGNVVAFGATGTAAAATLLDSGQPLGQPAAGPGLSDTQWLSDDGVYVSTNLTLNVASGSMQGVVYIRDNWERSD